MTGSQAAAILAYLRSHPEGLTALEAMNLGFGMRLAARIADIKDGMLDADEVIVVTDEPHDGGRHARYRLRTDARLHRTVDEWERYQQSPHARHGHLNDVPGCEWCERGQVIDARFRSVTGNHPEPAPDPVAEGQESLWGDAA